MSLSLVVIQWLQDQLHELMMNYVGPWKVHSMLEPRITCVHDYEINIPNIQDFFL